MAQMFKRLYEYDHNVLTPVIQRMVLGYLDYLFLPAACLFGWRGNFLVGIIVIYFNTLNHSHSSTNICLEAKGYYCFYLLLYHLPILSSLLFVLFGVVVVFCFCVLLFLLCCCFRFCFFGFVGNVGGGCLLCFCCCFFFFFCNAVVTAFVFVLMCCC